MAELQKGSDNLQKICEMLREQTLQPAQKEAEHIIEKARREAENILHEARTDAKKLLAEGRRELEKEKKAMHAALEMAAKQALGSLKQTIEHRLFDLPLDNLVQKASSHAQPVADMLSALVQAVKKEGLSTQMTAIIAKACPFEHVLPLLAKDVYEALGKEKIEVGNFAGGVQLRLKDRRICLDVSSDALKELLAAHLRKEFRKYVFGAHDLEGK